MKPVGRHVHADKGSPRELMAGTATVRRISPIPLDTVQDDSEICAQHYSLTGSLTEGSEPACLTRFMRDTNTEAREICGRPRISTTEVGG